MHRPVWQQPWFRQQQQAGLRMQQQQIQQQNLRMRQGGWARSQSLRNRYAGPEYTGRRGYGWALVLFLFLALLFVTLAIMGNKLWP